MWLRSTVTIIDLELRVLVAYRAADGVYGDVPPPMRVFDELLDQRLQLMAASDRVNARRGSGSDWVSGSAAEFVPPHVVPTMREVCRG